MSKNLSEIQDLFDDVIQRCDTLLKNNFDKFLDYAKRQEVLRLEFIKTSNDYKYLKTWLDKASEDIITLQSEQSDLSKLYEVLLRKNCVKKFYDYVKDQEALKINLAETINKYKNLNRMMNTANVDIILLKSECKDFIRGYKESLQKTVVRTLLDAQQETLRLKFIDKINDCERLKASLDSAFKSIMTLRSIHDDLIKRYRELSENNIVKEFIDTAKSQEPIPLESNETPKNCQCSPAFLERTKADIASLNLQLIEARKMLNSEQMRCEQVEIERESSTSISDGLCRSLLNHQQSTPDDVGKEYPMQNQSIQNSENFSVNIPSNYSSTNVESDPSPIPLMNETESKNNIVDFIEIIPCDSVEQNHHLSYLNEDDNEPIVIKEEKVDEPPVVPADPGDKLTECSSLPFEDNKLFQNEVDETVPSLKVKNESDTFTAIENLSLLDRIELRKRNNEHLQNSFFEDDHEPDIKKKTTDILPDSFAASNNRSLDSSMTYEIPNRRKLRERKTKTNPMVKVSESKLESGFHCDTKESSSEKNTQRRTTKVVVEVLFSCEKCGKSFVVKPNERKLQRCPFCDIIGAKKRVGEESMASTLKMTYKSVYEVHKHQCSVCDQYFLEKTDLTRHLREEHLKATPFKCSECKKSFTTKSKLERHTLVIHISKRSLECSICNTRKLEGSNHKNQCAHCDRQFSDKHYLAAHLVKHHYGMN